MGEEEAKEEIAFLFLTSESLMCRIIRYIGKRDTIRVLTEGLKRLECRGYDSAGIAVFHDGKIEIRRTDLFLIPRHFSAPFFLPSLFNSWPIMSPISRETRLISPET